MTMDYGCRVLTPVPLFHWCHSVEFGGNVFQQSDLNTFFRKFDPPQVGHTPKLVSIGGGESCSSLVIRIRGL